MTLLHLTPLLINQDEWPLHFAQTDHALTKWNSFIPYKALSEQGFLDEN